MSQSDHRPGQSFHYASIDTEVLGRIVERATGPSLAQALSARLWQPLGCQTEARFIVDPEGAATASGGLCCTLRDMARLGVALANGGVSDDAQVIPSAFLDDLVNGSRQLLTGDVRELLRNGSYRSQFWLPERDRDTILAIGVFGKMLMISPSRKTGIATVSAWPDFIDPERFAMTMAACDAILDA